MATVHRLLPIVTWYWLSKWIPGTLIVTFGVIEKKDKNKFICRSICQQHENDFDYRLYPFYVTFFCTSTSSQCVVVQRSVGLQIDESDAALAVAQISVTYRFLLPKTLRLSNIHCELGRCVFAKTEWALSFSILLSMPHKFELGTVHDIQPFGEELVEIWL